MKKSTKCFNILFFSVMPKNQAKKKRQICRFCVSAGIRTLDPLIKSQLLYQLSYGDILAV